MENKEHKWWIQNGARRYLDSNSKKYIYYHMSRDIFSRCFIVTLLGGEFSNCHGKGHTLKEALSILKLNIRIRRKKN